MPKSFYCYEQVAARLQIEILPNAYITKQNKLINVVTKWTLNIVGQPQLEGRAEHLSALINTVLNYANCIVGGISKSFKSDEKLVTIYSSQLGHALVLRSNKLNIGNIYLQIDDAQLIDLVRCLDAVSSDKRITPILLRPLDIALLKKDQQIPVYKSFVAFTLAVLMVASSTSFIFLLPLSKIYVISSPKITSNKFKPTSLNSN
uniref:Uncharacterized protein n=1 Tax=Paulinella chromatophora TaxID=39717 RepID=B1X5J7_PAUCH|nr:hypothetical protein PCC_0802 [Paulinella chromatophora]ACB43216.1 hypothetical protein PCC_0802 [Paulinella chromatophora]